MSLLYPEEDQLIRDPSDEEDRLRLATRRKYEDEPGSYSATPQTASRDDAGIYDNSEQAVPQERHKSGLSPEWLATKAKIDQLLQEQPQRKKPSVWGQIAAGAIGGAAGFSNADGRAPQIDPSRAINNLNGTTAFNNQTADWKRRLSATQQQLQGQEDQRQAEQNQQAFGVKQRLDEAHANDYDAQAAERLAKSKNQPKSDIATTNAAREAEATRLGLTGRDRQTYILEGKLEPQKPEPMDVAPGHGVRNKTGGWDVPVPADDKPDSAEKLTANIAAKTRIADEQGLKGPERHHFIYGTPIPSQNIFQIPGLGLGTPSASSTVNGDEFLKTLPSGTSAQIRAIAEGRAALPPLGARGSGALIRDAVFKYDPEFSEQRAKMRQAFTTGKQGDNIRALNTATVHLDQLHEAALAMKNGSFQPGNALYNYVATKFGSDKVTNHAFVMNALAGEAATALKGNATDPEIAHVLTTLQPNMSPEQALGVTEAGLHVFGAKLNTVDESYRQINPGDRVWSPVLPAAKAVYAKYGVKPIQQQVATPAAPQTGGGFSVTDPHGKVHTFPTQQAADGFKRAAGIP